MSGIPDFAEFDTSDLTSAGPRWKKYTARFENLCLALGLKPSADDLARKKALFLHYIGQSCFDIYETMKADADDYAAVKKKLDEYFIPKYNSDFERHLFRKVFQEEGESLEAYCTRLKQCAVTCEFSPETLGKELKLQMIEGCRNKKLREKGLKAGVTLDQFLELGKSMDIAKRQAELMDNHLHQSRISTVESQSVNAVRHQRQSTQSRLKNDRREGRKCFKCGGSFPHDGECPAKSRRCHKCKQYGHYSKVCKSSATPRSQTFTSSKKSSHSGPSSHGRVYHVRHDPDTDSSEYSLAVCNRTGLKKIPKVSTYIHGVKCNMYMDTGTTVNTLDCATYEYVCAQASDPSLMDLGPCDSDLFPYGSNKPLPVRGMFKAATKSERTGVEAVSKVYVMKNATGNLMSYDTACDLQIIDRVNFIGDHSVKSTSDLHNVNSIINDYDTVFHGLGKLKNFQLKLNIDDTISPVHQKHRRVPFLTRPKVEKAIKKLYEDNICEDPENTPTPWVSPIVVVPKPRDPENVRICVDMRAANQAIKRVKHPLPTVHELIHDLNGCRVFTKLDLNQGYHQIELHPDSRYITTFSSHLGLHRYKRLNFGVNAASEKFQQIIEQVLEGLEGVRNISDDIIIASANVMDHVKHVRACLQRLMERGLTVNRAKCEFFKNSVEFFGNMFGEHGVSPDPRKVKAVREAPRPTDKRGVKSILGMANYVQRYIPGLASIVKPLRGLTKNDVEFVWNSDCEAAWTKLKDSLTSDTVMSYFDPERETELVVDASPHGLGAILTQIHHNKSEEKEARVVSYASRALDDVESRYSQIEREALAVRWGIEHFHLYLYDKQFVVISDHKPLVSVFKNVLAKPSPRIERWCLRLQQYSFKVMYSPGVNNPADYMSRHPIASQCDRGRKVTEEYVNYVCMLSVPKAVSLQEVVDATKNDTMLQNVISCVANNQWYKHDNVSVYEKMASELSVTEAGVLLRGHRIVVPVSLCRRIVDSAHEGHQGIVKTKALLRAKVWFPNMDSLVSRVIASCGTCAVVSDDERLRPLQMSELPDGPWQSLSADFGGPYPSGHYCLVVIDEYSRFPVVEIVTSTSAKTVIPVLDKIFATHGVPKVLKTDNGPPFQSHEFRAFMEYSGIRHRKITPLWPRANAQSENFMKPLNKAIKAATVEGKSWRQYLYKFLRNYRATPHTTTGRPPAELLFGRNIRVLLPEICNREDDDELRNRDANQKRLQKKYADARNCSRPTNDIRVGDQVFVRQQKIDKLTPAYMSQPLSVTKVNGTMITATDTVHGKGTKTRNASQFKPAPDPVQADGDEPNHDDTNLDTSIGVPPEPDPGPRRSSRTSKVPSKFRDFVAR